MKTLEINHVNAVNGGGNGFRLVPHEPEGNGVRTPSNHTLKIERSIAYMVQHLDQPLHVAKLAALANVSPSHYFALFKHNTGCAPIDFFIRLRMQHARELLDRTSLSVKEIAAELGYEDPFYFSRAFKSVNRVAPSAYRLLPPELKARLKPARLPGTVAGPASPPVAAHEPLVGTRHSVRAADRPTPNGARWQAEIRAHDLPETAVRTLEPSDLP